jgi:hypothetical protein
MPFTVPRTRFTLPNPHPNAMLVKYFSDAEILSVLLWPTHAPTDGLVMYAFQCQGAPAVFNNMLDRNGKEVAPISVTEVPSGGGRFLIEVPWPADVDDVKSRCAFVAVIIFRCTENELYRRSKGLHHQVVALAGAAAGGDIDGGKDVDAGG